MTGRISRIDPTTGARTTVATGIPSGSQAEGQPGFGVSDVVFLNGTIYYLISGSFDTLPGPQSVCLGSRRRVPSRSNGALPA